MTNDDIIAFNNYHADYFSFLTIWQRKYCKQFTWTVGEKPMFIYFETIALYGDYRLPYCV